MTNKMIIARNTIIGISLSILASSAHAAFTYKMNAMCFLPDTKDAQVEPFNPTKQEIKDSGSNYVAKSPTNVTTEDVTTKFRIASLSKVLVTHWATAILGPEYRFRTRISVTPTNPDKSCHAHISGSQDIFFGKEMLESVFKQLGPILKAQGCARIDQFSYDEKLIIPFEIGTSSFIVQHRNSSTFRGGDPNTYYGPLTTQRALTNYIRRFSKIRVNAIKPSAAADFADYAKTVPLTTYSFKSRPLFMMMREFNAYSSNVPPNILFDRLGGIEGYKNFIRNRLQLNGSDIDIMNGSGFPVKYGEEKLYNEVSCYGIVKVIQDLDHILRAYKGTRAFQLADVMAVGGNDEYFSTFKALYSSGTFANTLAAKTGSAEKAITFGGMLATKDGNLYFAALTEPSSYDLNQLNRPRTYIRDLVTILAERHTLKAFDYTQVGLMAPIDEYAAFVKETAFQPRQVLPTTLK